jgi:hypothetical protein
MATGWDVAFVDVLTAGAVTGVTLVTHAIMRSVSVVAGCVDMTRVGVTFVDVNT